MSILTSDAQQAPFLIIFFAFGKHLSIFSVIDQPSSRIEIYEKKT